MNQRDRAGEVPKRLAFVGKYFLAWLIWFEASRIIFLLYQWRQSSRISLGELGQILVHGATQDLSAAAVISFIPMCIVARAGSIEPRECRRILSVYTGLLAAVCAFVSVADIEIFRLWGFHVDLASLAYLARPREVFAALRGSPVAKLLIILAACLTFSLLLFRTVIRGLKDDIPRARLPQSFVVLVICTPAFLTAERGGFDWREPISATSGYFSPHMYSNRATSNPLWNLGFSAVASGTANEIERSTDSISAAAIVDSLLGKGRKSAHRGSPPELLKYRPRYVVVVLWESLNSKLLSRQENRRPVIGGLESFARQGILFSRMYAAGTRTTNALVATLSGLPSHPISNALVSARRSAQLPSLARAMSRAGYKTGFYYGGSLAFDNRGRYLLTGHYDKIVERDDFHGRPPMSPWGVHDPIVLDKLFADLDTASAPVFAATLTLSSHEPYTVPGSPMVPGSGAEKQFLNAQAYTDRAVSTLLMKLQKSRRWDSTLVVILGDHGAMFPLDTTSFWGAPQEFNIPMVWVGGALASRGIVIDAIGSQADIPALLLDQLGLDRSAFPWSKDFIIPGNAQFAYFAFPNAFGFVDPHGSYVFDNLSRQIAFRTGDRTVESVAAGRAFQQEVTESYAALAKSTAVTAAVSR